MAKVKSGFAFHVHHDKLLEFCTDYQERVDYIKGFKPKSEVKLRLHLFKLIPKNRLPVQLVEAGKAYNEAGKAYDEAWKAYNEALKACDEAGKAHNEALKACDEAGKAHNEAGKAYNEAWKAYNEAWKAYNEAWKAYNKALKAYNEAGKACESIIIKLHSEWCPNCPWDGKTILRR